jgi:hypothetical protein
MVSADPARSAVYYAQNKSCPQDKASYGEITATVSATEATVAERLTSVSLGRRPLAKAHAMLFLEMTAALSFVTGMLVVPAVIGAALLNVNFILSDIGAVAFDGRFIALQAAADPGPPHRRRDRLRAADYARAGRGAADDSSHPQGHVQREAIIALTDTTGRLESSGGSLLRIVVSYDRQGESCQSARHSGALLKRQPRDKAKAAPDQANP